MFGDKSKMNVIAWLLDTHLKLKQNYKCQSENGIVVNLRQVDRNQMDKDKKVVDKL